MALLCACLGSYRQSHTVHRYPDGSASHRFETRDGEAHGSSVRYSRSGAIIVKGHYYRGERHGVFEYFDDGGEVKLRVVYIRGSQVWRGSSPAERPPAGVLEALKRTGQDRPSEDLERELEVASGAGPVFSMLDHVPASPRVSFWGGFGGGTEGADFSLVSRFGFFSAWSSSTWGGYLRGALSIFDDASMRTATGRWMLEPGGLRHFELPAGRLTARVGAAFPVKNDDQPAAFAPSALAAHQRPSDAVDGFRGGAAARSSLSYALARGRLQAQADLGADAIFGAGNEDLQILTRGNLGVSYGVDSVRATAELASAVMPSEAQRRLLSVGGGFVLRARSAWLTAMILYASNEYVGVNFGFGRDI